jgi:steroid 5-alpha reductase family enzyme
VIEIWFQGWLLVAVLFFLLWLHELRGSDATLVDAGWAAGLGGLAALYAFRGPGLLERRVLMAVLAGAWSVRLAGHILRRHRRSGEDGRYRELRARWKERAHRFFFFFFQAQGLLACVLSLPFLLIAFDRAPGLRPVEVFGFALVLAAAILEAVSDRQLERHRRDPRNGRETFRAGLWRYSRHPNFFFEWLVWVGFAIAALGAPYGGAALLSPALMLCLILGVTGIPPLEKRALRRRGEDYRRYQRTTSAFVPWFPRSEGYS